MNTFESDIESQSSISKRIKKSRELDRRRSNIVNQFWKELDIAIESAGGAPGASDRLRNEVTDEFIFTLRTNNIIPIYVASLSDYTDQIRNKYD